MDSELIVKQMGGEYRVRDADLKPLHERVCKLLESFSKVDFSHVKRDKNKRADWLLNKALDKAT